MTYTTYVTRKTLPEEDDAIPAGLPRILTHKYYIDELYHVMITKPLDALSAFTYKYFENGVIDGIVNGTGKALTGLSGLLRFSQTGNIGGYIFSMVIGIIIIIVLTLIV